MNLNHTRLRAHNLLISRSIVQTIHCRIDLSFEQLLFSCKTSKISWIIFQTQFQFKKCKIGVSDRHYLNVWFKIVISNTAIIVVKVIDFTMASGSSTIKHRIKSEYLFSIQAGHYYNVNHNCSPMTSIWKCGFHQNLKNCSCIWSFWQVCLLRF